MAENWTTDAIPDLTGKVTIVTGANSGIGYEAALTLAQKGATVVVASRDTNKGAEAVSKIQGTHPKGSAIFMQLDLANLASVRAFAEKFSQQFKSLDLLINN